MDGWMDGWRNQLDFLWRRCVATHGQEPNSLLVGWLGEGVLL